MTSKYKNRGKYLFSDPVSGKVLFRDRMAENKIKRSYKFKQLEKRLLKKQQRKAENTNTDYLPINGTIGEHAKDNIGREWVYTKNGWETEIKDTAGYFIKNFSLPKTPYFNQEVEDGEGVIYTSTGFYWEAKYTSPLPKIEIDVVVAKRTPAYQTQPFLDNNNKGFIDFGDTFKMDDINHGLTAGGLGLSLSKGKFMDGLNYNFHNNAPKGKFGVTYNNEFKYWGENFKGGTRARISPDFVSRAKYNARLSVNAGNAFKGVARTVNFASILITGYSAYSNWDTATANEKYMYGLDMSFGVMAFTPLAPFATAYFLGRWYMDSEKEMMMNMLQLNRHKTIDDIIMIKIDKTRIGNKHYPLLKK